MSNDFVTQFLADKDKVSISANDMFDRVINLKLYVKNKDGTPKDTYVIRSDYELYYPNLMDTVAHNNIESFISQNDCIIRKCQHKPSIKVQYKRVSPTASIEVDIFISNFYMLDKDGNLLSGFNNDTYPLSRVDFAMGYFGQFKALFSDQTPNKAEQLFDIGFIDDNNPKDYSNPSVGHGITVMTMGEVEYTQLDKLPPDMTLHIHGYVGNTLAPQLDYDISAKNFPKEYNRIMSSQAVIPSELKGGRTTYLEEVYYQTITRKWIKKGTPSKLKSTEIEAGKEYTTDIMSEKDADRWGIKVYLSKGAKEYSKLEIEAKFKKDANGNVIKPTIKIPTDSTAEGTMSAIENAFGLKGFAHVLLDSFGDYVVYLQEELNDIKAMLKGTTFEKLFENTALHKSWNNNIPAVYNITNDALCTIVCPFFCFINPFEKLYFKSRYALGGLVSYYANITNVNRNEFYALWQNVSFATVENINECMIVCTGQKKE